MCINFEIFIINLKRSPERRNKMRKNLKKINITFQFVDAIDHKDELFSKVNRYNKKKKEAMYGFGLTPAEIACFASHYELWKYCADYDVPLIIMEDDVDFTDHFNEAADWLKENISKYNFIRLSSYFESKYKSLDEINSNLKLVRYMKGPRGTQCYALTPKAARKLIKHSSEWIHAVDEFIDFSFIHGLPSYAIIPSPVYEVAGVSDIGNRKHKNICLSRKVRREFTRSYNQLRLNLFNLKLFLFEESINKDT